MAIKIIDGESAIMGRLASYVAKELLKGEEIAVVNSDKVIITGNKTSIKKDFEEQRSRFGSSQKGPVHHKSSEKIVKRVIRGMLPNHRFGRGREAFKRVKCYNGIPKEFETQEKINLNHAQKHKFARVKDFTK